MPGLGGIGTDAWIVAGLVLVSVLLYARTSGFDFVDFDDRTILLAHPNLYSDGTFLTSLREIFIGYFPREEPLLVRDVSWAVDARLFGFTDPRGYHVGNIVINSLVVGTLFLFLRRTTRSRTVAGLSTLAFAVLPIHVEPVAWIMGRKDLLAAFFMLGGLLAQSIELTSLRPYVRRFAWCVTFLCCVLALGSKISTIAFVLVLALHRVLFPYLERGDGPERKLDVRSAMRRLPALVPHGVATVLVFIWYRGVLADYGVIRNSGPGPLDPAHLGNVLQFLPLVAGEYLRHLFAPGELSMFYRWPHVEIPLSAGEQLASIAWAVGGISGIGYLLAKRRDLAFYALFAVALLLPYTGLFYVGFWHADRYFYLASAGVLALIGIGLRDLGALVPRTRPAVYVLVLGFIVSSAAVTWRHQEVWENDESLWSYEANRSEPSLLSIQALAKYYVRRAEAAESPELAQKWLGLATEQADRGLRRNAEMARQPSAYRVPEQKHLARIHVTRGRIAAMQGAPPPIQLEHYRRAFELAPERLSAIMVSRSLFQMAGGVPEEERPRWIEASFDYFLRYLEFSATDPRQLEQGRQLLESNYGERFPFLQARVDQARTSWFQ